VTVPTLNVAGWWDQEDFYGPLKIYELLERHDTANKNFLVVGPWNHGGWSRSDGQKLGRIEFGSATAVHYRRNVLAPFLAYYLKGKGNLDQPEALTFRTGANEWVRHDAWPPKHNVVARRLTSGGFKSFSSTGRRRRPGDAFDSYVLDPANWVPIVIDQCSGWTWLVEQSVSSIIVRVSVTSDAFKGCCRKISGGKA
jgi:predicted acyl esterase